MTYKEWAEEYYQTAKSLKEKITALKKQMKKAPPHKLYIISNNIRILNDAYYECLEIARSLAVRKGEC